MRPSRAEWPSSVRFPGRDGSRVEDMGPILTGGSWSWDHQRQATHALRSARQALGLRSQQQLADAVTRAGNSIGLRISITARTVRRWESDAPPWPHPDHQAAVEALFQRPIAELGFTPPWAGARIRHSAAGERPGFPGRHGQLTRRLTDAVPATPSGRAAAGFCRHRLHLRYLGPSAHVLGCSVGATARCRCRARQSRRALGSVRSRSRAALARGGGQRIEPAGRPHRILRPAKPLQSTGQSRYRAPSGARCTGRSSRLRSGNQSGVLG